MSRPFQPSRGKTAEGGAGEKSHRRGDRFGARLTWGATTTCAAGPGDSADPFAGGTTSVPFQQECVAKDAEGGCLKYTCKADQASDCAGFANGCVRGGNHYAGTAEGGACSKML
jgi:hypothetical protein